MSALSLRQLDLTAFRNYETLRLTLRERDEAPWAIVLHGPNGAGKTNLLEAISLLTPGRGLRGAKPETFRRHSHEGAWAISAEIDGRQGSVRIATGSPPGDPASTRRVVRVAGEAAGSQTALAEHLTCVWLTPAMDRLFMEGASDRRRFLDRLVFAFDPAHAGRVTRYERLLRERAQLLTSPPEGRAPDPTWLSTLEAQMAETAIGIAAARRDLVKRLNRAAAIWQDLSDAQFPQAQLNLDGAAEAALEDRPASDVEDELRACHLEDRAYDASHGGARHGVHRTDLAVTERARGMAAALGSTGEQKALLLGIVLAHAQLLTAELGAAPILLLDEVAAHLDPGRRAALYERLRAGKSQTWLTGTEPQIFNTMPSGTAFYRVAAGTLHLGA